MNTLYHITKAVLIAVICTLVLGAVVVLAALIGAMEWLSIRLGGFTKWLVRHG